MNASKDQNNIDTILGMLNTNGATPIRIKADPATHILQAVDGSDGEDAGADLAARDDNGYTTLTATDADGNIIPIFADENGNILIKST